MLASFADRRRGRLRTAVCVLAMAALPLVAAPAARKDYPRVRIEPCCQLCPAAADPQRYASGYLSSFRNLVQGREGWLFRTDADLLMDLGPSPEGLARLGHLRRALQQRGIELVMVVQPPRGLMHADKLGDSGASYDPQLAQARYAVMLDALREQGIVVPELERLTEEGGQGSYFFRADHHWTPEGARRTAKIVAERIRQMPQYQGLRHQRFVTRRDGLLAKRGTMHKAAQMLCGFGAPAQFVPRYVTETAEAPTQLLGDAATPQVTLVGTSNSDAPYNFSGFLSEYLGVDVLNAAVTGGGFEGSMLSYLPSAEFQGHPPRILIWELETYHDISDPRFYQQAMPLLGRDCGGRAAVLERRLSLRAGRNEALFNGGGRVLDLRGRDHFLDIQFGDTRVRELRAVVWYSNGSKDVMRLERPERAAGAGRFVLDLRDEGHWGDLTFLSLDIESLPSTAGPAAAPAAAERPPKAARQVHARLCRREPVGASTEFTASLGESTP